MNEDLAHGRAFSDAELFLMLRVVGVDLGIGRLRRRGRGVCEEPGASEVILLFDDPGAGIVSHGGGDFVRRDLAVLGK